jgi:predicted DNA-binding protein (MmcQ/YjbR family)
MMRRINIYSILHPIIVINAMSKIHDYLMQLPNAVLDYPFGADIHVYKVEGKIFAIYFCSDQVERINLKCAPVLAQELRTVFTEVTPGYHMNKKHWNTVDLKGNLPDSEIQKMIDHSYDLVVKSLPKAVKQKLRIRFERLAWL